MLRGLHVAGVTQCLAACGRLEPHCGAVQYRRLASGQTLCQLFARGVCSSDAQNARSLTEAAGVHYMDVPPRNVTLREREGALWEHRSCSELGYCSRECLAKEQGDFCAADAACASLAAADSAIACVNNQCVSELDWQVTPTLRLSTWQEWAVDTSGKHWKKLLPGTCRLEFRARLEPSRAGALRLVLATSSEPDRLEAVIDIGLDNNSKTEVTLGAQTFSFPTPGVLTSNYSQYLLHWCSGDVTFGPVDQSPLVRAQLPALGPVSFVDVQPLGESLLALVQFRSGLADAWLFEEQGVSEDPELQLAADQYLFIRRAFSSLEQIRFFCRAEAACVIRVRPRVEFVRDIRVEVNDQNVSVCVLTPAGRSGCQSKAHLFRSANASAPFSISREFVYLTVIFWPDGLRIDTFPFASVMFTGTVPFEPTTMLMGIGGPGATTLKQYHSQEGIYRLWKTSSWLTEGSGFSSMAGLLPDP